jgi:hypothetical protein
MLMDARRSEPFFMNCQFNSPKNPPRLLIVFPFYWWENQSRNKLSNLTKVQLVSGRVRI